MVDILFAVGIMVGALILFALLVMLLTREEVRSSASDELPEGRGYDESDHHWWH